MRIVLKSNWYVIEGVVLFIYLWDLRTRKCRLEGKFEIQIISATRKLRGAVIAL